jgi:hypothetical protein
MIVTQQLDGFWRQSTNQALDRKSFITSWRLQQKIPISPDLLLDSGSFPRGGSQKYLYADLPMQGWWVAVRSALNLGAPRAASSRGGGWVVLCRSVWDRQ